MQICKLDARLFEDISPARVEESEQSRHLHVGLLNVLYPLSHIFLEFPPDTNSKLTLQLLRMFNFGRQNVAQGLNLFFDLEGKEGAQLPAIHNYTRYELAIPSE